MTALSQDATQSAISAYRAMRAVVFQAFVKRDSLYVSNPLYAAVEFNSLHPYDDLPKMAMDALTKFEQVLSGVLKCNLGATGTIADELDQVAARRAARGEPADATVAALRRMKPTAPRVSEVLHALQAFFLQMNALIDYVEQENISACLAVMHGELNVAHHLESPLVSLVPECENAIKEVQQFARSLRDAGIGLMTMGIEVDAMRILIFGNGRAEQSPKNALVI